MDPRFGHQTYTVRRKVLKLLGGAFHIYDPLGNVAFYSELKAFKLKEDIRLFGEEAKQTELLTIKARKILDLSSAYDVADSTTGEKVGVLKRKGLKSVIRDEWTIMNAQDQEIGIIQEDSQLMALIRRFLTNLIPQKYTATIQNQPVATYQQNFNPFVLKITIDFSPDKGNLYDRRLGIAAAVLLAGIEGRQQ